MKITDTKGLPHPYERAEAKPAKTSAAAPAAVDSVKLSGSLAGMSAQIAAEPHFDAAKVEDIKAAIRDGRFQINPEAIADKLLSSVEALLTRPH